MTLITPLSMTPTVAARLNRRLHDAVLLNSAPMARAALADGADPNGVNTRGESALGAALNNINNDALVRCLVEGGADIDEVHRATGRTALMNAAWHRNDAAVAFLLAMGARVDFGDARTGGRTALMMASSNGEQEGQRAVVARLLAAGADPNKADHQGGTALIRAAGEGAVAVVRLLLAAGADARQPDKNGVGPLAWAVANGHDGAAEALIAAGADVNQTTDPVKGGSVLAVALLGPLNDGARLVRALLEAGADPNARDRAGCTVLMYAASNNRPGIDASVLATVRLLLDAGADPTATNQGNRAADFARHIGDRAGLADVLQAAADRAVLGGVAVVRGAMPHRKM